MFTTVVTVILKSPTVKAKRGEGAPYMVEVMTFYYDFLVKMKKVESKMRSFFDVSREDHRFLCTKIKVNLELDDFFTNVNYL